MTHAITVILVNDFPLVLAGLQAMLAPYADRVTVIDSVVGEPRAVHADLALLDTFGADDVAERVHRLIAHEVAHGVVVFSWNLSIIAKERAAAAGALGFVSKRLNPQHLVSAIESLYGTMPGCPARVDRPFSDVGDISERAAWPGQAEGLAVREAEVLALITRGLRNEEIASTLFLSINSIKRYIRSTYRKIGVTSRTEALLWALDHGFARPPAGATTDPSHRT